MGKIESLKVWINGHVLTPGVRKFVFDREVKMLSSDFAAFTVPFVTVGAVGLLVQLSPWILRTGVTDIDPLPILFFAFLAGFTSLYLRYLILKRYSNVRP